LLLPKLEQFRSLEFISQRIDNDECAGWDEQGKVVNMVYPGCISRKKSFLADGGRVT
jgi:hypothetical protein